MNRVTALITIVCALMTASAAQAQSDFPTRPVRIVVGWAPGSGIDIITRLYARKLEEKFGQSFVVENRPGASGNIAAASVARTTPDGYTLMSNGATQAISMSLFKNLTFDIAKDFEAISSIGIMPSILTVNAETKINSVGELIAAAKARPNELTYATSGTGSVPHLSGELFNLRTGAKLRHVPYRGNVQALADVIAGHVPVMFPPAAVVISQRSDTRVRLLATTSAKRMSLFPEIPSLSETPGLEGFDSSIWSALWAPKGTPQDIVRKINAAITSISDMPDIKEMLAANATDPMKNSPEEFAAFVRAEVEKWAKVIEFSGTKAE